MAHRLLALAALALVGVTACGDPDPYYRNLQVQVGVGDAGIDTGPKPGAAGTAGHPNPTGAAGVNGAGGTSSPFTGTAGTNGSAGTSPASGSGAAGSSAAGTAGTTGAAGGPSSSTGTAGTTAVPCSGCKIAVMYTCLSDASDQASFVVEVQNKGTVAFLTGDLTLRYWFTQDAGKEPELNCDTARIGCQKVATSSSQPPVKFTPVTPARPKANMTFDVTFPPGAVDVGGTTGTIQLRLNNKDHTPMNQGDDYSVDCGQKNVAHDSGKITAYIKGALVGGTEP